MGLPSSPPRSPLLRRIPALDSLRHYGVGQARADLLAGFSVAAVAVPQAMAYAMIAGLPAEYGLYTAIVMTAVGAVLDSSRQLINGPTNAISIALLSAIGGIAAPDERVQAAVLIALMVGAIQLGISLLRLGDLTRYISHSVIVGFTAGASLLLVLDQTKNLLGLKAVGDAHDHFLYRFWLTVTEGGSIHHATLAVGVASIAAVLLLRLLKRRLDWKLLPEFLIVVVLAAAATAWLGLDRQGVKVVGDIPASLPAFRLPSVDAVHLREYSTSALAIGLLGLLEAIAMAKAIAAVTHQKLDLNQQCLSEGFANLVGSFFQCMPGSGSLTRSAINQQAGGQTQWSGVVSAVAVALIMLVFAPYARFIPRSALAGLLMLTAARMVNVHDLRYHVRTSRFDAAIVAVTAIAAFAISIEFCVLIGVFMSFMLAVPRTGQMHLTQFLVAGDGTVHEHLRDDEVCGCLLIFGLEGEMYFGSAASLEARVEAMTEHVRPWTQAVVLRMKRARNPDAVGIATFERFVEQLLARGVRVVVCGVRDGMFACMRNCGLADKIGAANIFREDAVRLTSTARAIRHASSILGDSCPRCGGRGSASTKQGALYYSI
ncbi:MAG: SulP family inorganic anion transporter [bacterium]|nr:SulP family inorganic anion transporter [bacterium]